jgi:carboxyl-terminal processing protease
LWSITEVVLDNHLAPPSRQEMLLGAIRGFYQAARQTPPHGLSRRISGLMTEKDFTTLLQDLWPGKTEGKPPSAPSLEAAAIGGMLQTIPGKAAILPRQEMKIVNSLSSNRYVGIGVQLAGDKETGYTKILVPFRRGPARRAGSRPGDLIVSINGKDVHKMPLEKVVETLRGELGSRLAVVVRQPGGQPRTLNMVREVVPFDTLAGYRRVAEDDWKYQVDASSGIAYVWVKSINASTLHELRKLERRLKSEGARALVLDLRFGGGSGGVLHAALFTDGLLDGGLMWRFRNSSGQFKEFRADRECLFRGWPLAVLVDNTLVDMATQMVAAALQDNRRAVLVGETTRGDGYANALIPLPGRTDSIVLRSSVVERSVERAKPWGVEPDHKVALGDAQRQAVEKWLREKDLPELPANADDRPPEDPQLARAVEVLRQALQKSPKAAR